MTPDTSDGYRAPFATGYIEPAEQTGSDEETTPIRRDTRPIRQRYDKWRLYHRVLRDGSVQWSAYQPEDVDAPMFPAHDALARTIGGSYGYWSNSGQAALAMLQLAMAKAEA